MKTTKVAFFGILVVGLLAMTWAVGTAETPAQSPDQQEVLQKMVQWNKDLGVTCDYCHTQDKTRTVESLEGTTAAATELTPLLHRRVARDMEAMMQMANDQQSANMTCQTCHRGSAKIAAK
jgi:hypothetical protein